MEEQPHTAEALIREIARYLAAVDLFRAECCEPKWLPELPSSGIPSRRPVLTGARDQDARLAQ